MSSGQSDLKARSPWASLQSIKSVTLSPSAGPLHASLRVPGSKSYTNRALIIAAAARGSSVLSGILQSDDSYWCIEALRKLGADIAVENDVATITGVNAEWRAHPDPLYIGAAGTTARFLPGVLCAARNGSWTLDGSNRLKERPIDELVRALRELGAEISYLSPGNSFPLQINARGLRGGKVTVSGKISSQFLSGILIASALAEDEVTVTVTDGIVQPSYIDMTISLMRIFGANVVRNETLTKIHISPTRYTGHEINLEADASTTCYFLALGALTGGRITIENLGYSTSQPDIKMLDVLEQMGCQVTREKATVSVSGITSSLKGGFTMSMREMSDQTMTLAILAAFADAPITLTDVAHIRHHECDRISSICEILRRAGVRVSELHDGLIIHAEGKIKSDLSQVLFPSFDDHRMAMSTSLLAARCHNITIDDPGCVSKTCPTFFELVKGLGMQVEYRRETNQFEENQAQIET